jgi:hypothetical protein
MSTLWGFMTGRASTTEPRARVEARVVNFILDESEGGDGQSMTSGRREGRRKGEEEEKNEGEEKRRMYKYESGRLQ